jgi:uncharacterized protein (DUF169 family)
MKDYQALHDALHGHVRGHPVGITLFYDEVPASYAARKAVPCAIVRLAMDEEQICYIDGQHQDCITGAFTAGVHEGTEEIRTGGYLAKNIPAMTDIAAARGKAGRNVLPPGMVKAIGAAPLHRIPDGIRIDWIVVVCNPQWANWIASARSVLDGTPPEAAAGTSFCSELFAVPWHTDNVVMSPGDMGGRMNNKLRPEEMFVIVPAKYADSLLNIVTDSLRNVNARGALEATKPPDSPYWDKRRRAAGKARAHAGADAAGDEPQLVFTLRWDDEAQALIRQTPAGIIDVAVTTVEEYAREHGHALVTRAVLEAQMKSIGMDPAGFLG